MSSHHVTQARWSNLTILEQMGNIGSEIGRAFSAQKRGDTKSMEAALYRGLDLFDATAETLTDKPRRLNEVLRAREQFAESILSKKPDPELDDYFLQFAIAARLNR